MKQTASIFNLFQSPHPAIITATQNHTCIALHRFVNQAIAVLSLKAIHKTELLVNNVQYDLMVSTDKTALNTIVNFLLGTVLLHSQDNSIQVSAKLIGNITVMHIKTNDTGQVDAITRHIDKIQPMARSIGGCVTISNGKLHGINLAFTFINH